jgi:hypothetical protein
MAVSVTANSTATPLGGTGSAAQAGAMGSSGGTTTGTVACSSCCAPQGRYLTGLFGGYGQAGLCPGAIDNSQPFPVYFTFVLTMNPPYTAAQFCLPSSFTLVGTATNFINVNFIGISCTTISPPATTSSMRSVFVASSAGYITLAVFPAQNYFYMNLFLCGCSQSPNFYTPTNSNAFSLVSCSPPVFSFLVDLLVGANTVGNAAVTITF